MDIAWNTSPSLKNGFSTGTVVIQAGKTLKIETSPQGVEVLNVQVPDEKTWTVHISISIEES